MAHRKQVFLEGRIEMRFESKFCASSFPRAYRKEFHRTSLLVSGIATRGISVNDSSNGSRRKQLLVATRRRLQPKEASTYTPLKRLAHSLLLASQQQICHFKLQGFSTPVTTESTLMQLK